MKLYSKSWVQYKIESWRQGKAVECAEGFIKSLTTLIKIVPYKISLQWCLWTILEPLYVYICLWYNCKSFTFYNVNVVFLYNIVMCSVWSHRCTAIAVWRARWRRRLHDDVGHIAGVISTLLYQLKDRKSSSVHLSVCTSAGFCFVLFLSGHFLLSLCVCEYWTGSVCMCSANQYLAFLRQDHRLGEAKLLTDIMQRGRVMALSISIAKGHHAQVVRGGCMLRTLHRD